MCVCVVCFVFLENFTATEEIQIRPKTKLKLTNFSLVRKRDRWRRAIKANENTEVNEIQLKCISVSKSFMPEFY